MVAYASMYTHHTRACGYRYLIEVSHLSAYSRTLLYCYTCYINIIPRICAHTRSYIVVCLYTLICILHGIRHSAHPFTRAFRIRIIRNRIFTPSSGTCTGTLSCIPCLNHLSYNVIALFRTIAHVRSRNIAAILRAKNTFWCLHIFKCLFRATTRQNVKYSATGCFRTSGISDSRTSFRRSSHSP